ncbi:serine protease inhibitor swm-1-like isoform X2 [Epargyreus clarus]|uniref:serine protease inhibitor swm-1-like isoform X2 n=1 Tax=Epargyreus clarus TaxID=520877 RepID=UPI003C2E98F1
MGVKTCLILNQFMFLLMGTNLYIQIVAKTFDIQCGPNQIFNQCQRCEKTCSNLNPTCIGPCQTGCFCNNDLVKAPNGKCVELKECPKEITLGVQDISIEDCGSNEEFLSCGWCEPSCSEPEPQCSTQTCTRGCLCRPPLLRHHSGQCVERKNCVPQKCFDSNEEFVCRYGCEARCDNRMCVRPKRCTLGCYCKLGLLRDITGHCVTANNCYRFGLTQYTNASSVNP